MVKPSAPVLATGLVLGLVAGALYGLAIAGLSFLGWVAILLGVASSIVLVVGVYRLASNVDAAAGVRYVEGSTGISNEELERQAAARRALAGD